MTPQFQTILDSGRGDCYRACVASLLDVPVPSVPHVFHDAPGYNVGFGRMQAWLRKRGQALLTFPVFAETPRVLFADMKRLGNDAHFILCGRSRHGCGHAVVCKGGRIVHDPNPRKSGIVEPLEDGIVFLAQVIVASRT